MGEKHQVVISEAELRQRIAELGRQISKDYEGRVVHCVGVLESGFIFIADLVRAITCEVRCQFVKPYQDVVCDRQTEMTQIFYSPEIKVQGEHILLCEAILSTGLTTDFLIRHFHARGAASVAVWRALASAPAPLPCSATCPTSSPRPILVPPEARAVPA
jgi:hypoxanthine phosphoribosyltransferase